MILQELDQQFDGNEAGLLRTVLTDLAERIHRILGADLAGVYLKGSFALGAGDVHADVDFLVATAKSLNAAQEQAVRELHAVLPDRDEHWAHNLEGSHASLDDLRKRADPSTLWLVARLGRGGRRRDCVPSDRPASPSAMSSIADVRRLVPVVCALAVLIALWPVLCMSGEDEPTSCQSAVFIPLPWGESADTWGMVVPILGAVLTYLLLRRLLRRSSTGTVD